MDPRACLHELGLPPEAGALQIQRAYKARSRALKSLLLGARSLENKDRHRRELRQLFLCREVALGRTVPRDWRAQATPDRGARLRERLERVSLWSLDGAGARAFLGVPRDAAPEAVLRAYRRLARVLVRQFARAADEAEMRALRRARARLRAVREQAL